MSKQSRVPAPFDYTNVEPAFEWFFDEDSGCAYSKSKLLGFIFNVPVMVSWTAQSNTAIFQIAIPTYLERINTVIGAIEGCVKVMNEDNPGMRFELEGLPEHGCAYLRAWYIVDE